MLTSSCAHTLGPTCLAVRQHATPPAVLGQGISVLSATGAVVVRRRDLVPGRVESGEGYVL